MQRPRNHLTLFDAIMRRLSDQVSAYTDEEWIALVCHEKQDPAERSEAPDAHDFYRGVAFLFILSHVSNLELHQIGDVDARFVTVIRTLPLKVTPKRFASFAFAFLWWLLLLMALWRIAPQPIEQPCLRCVGI